MNTQVSATKRCCALFTLIAVAGCGSGGSATETGGYDPAAAAIQELTFDACSGEDTSGLGRNAIVVGTSCVSGKHGSAAEFHNPGFNTFGGSDWVELPAHTGAAVTFTAWVKWAGETVSGDGYAGAIWSLGTHTVEPFLSIWINEGSGRIWTDSYSTSPHKLTPGVWTMLTITSDGLGESLYLNGDLVNSAAFPAPKGFNGLPGYLARHFWASGQNAARFRGIIDEVKVYNIALSPAEVSALYNSTR
jgi:hypothetical protein